ncbi:histidine kinase [Marinomonas sp. CT5]|uniref:EAL and HDOD domain-containing protein n=1 Tax=Marinomonas sp. CT5 TaxID=2066133 RepID=UPI001BAE78C0|nr:HDOD domain-containing protein [Marinomonas sp. CT5]QUX95908.1 histidine kinase [Marinomonas sp. CT5]
MKNNDVLFCTKAVVNLNSQTIAYFIVHPDNKIEEKDASFLSSLFIDSNITEITQQKTIFFQSHIDQLSKLPLQSNIHMVIFIDGIELQEEHLDTLSALRLDGYELGIKNPDLKAIPPAILDVFTSVVFNLNQCSIENVIESCKNELISTKNIWIDEVEKEDQFNTLKQAIPEASFSGNFIKRVNTIKGKRILAYKAILIDLLIALNDQESSPRVLADYIERDPTLTYRVIKLTHTAHYRSQFNVSSAQRAVEIIGIRDLIKWVSLVMLSSISGKPDCLFPMAVSRACFCQSLAKALSPKVDGAFIVGLFSYLPSFLDDDLPSLLKNLPLEENIKAALLEYKGNLGGVLRIVEDYEAGRWEKIPLEQLQSKNITKQSLKDLYVESFKEAKEMMSL